MSPMIFPYLFPDIPIIPLWFVHEHQDFPWTSGFSIDVPIIFSMAPMFVSLSGLAGRSPAEKEAVFLKGELGQIQERAKEMKTMGNTWEHLGKPWENLEKS